MIDPIIGDKQCSKCGLIKRRTEFHANSKTPSGLHAQCKACRLAKAHQRTVERARADYRDVRTVRRPAEESPTAWWLPAQDTAEAHRLWQSCDVAMGGERRLAA